MGIILLGLVWVVVIPLALWGAYTAMTNPSKLYVQPPVVVVVTPEEFKHLQQTGELPAQKSSEATQDTA
jgi:hypothetical protein